MTITIVNLKNEKPSKPYDFKIDRTTPVGNPYPLPKYTRDESCDMYSDYFAEQFIKDNHKFIEYIRTLQEAYEIYGLLRLFCWCEPLRCHGKTIKSFLDPNTTFLK